MALSLLALATQLLIGENKVDSKSEPVIDRKEQHLRALERKINTKVLDVYSALENYRNTSFAIPFFIPAFEESKVSTAIKLSDKGSTLDIEIPNPINSWAKFDGFYCNLITESIYNDVLDNLLKSQSLLLFNSLKRVNISINYLEYSSGSAKDKYSNPIPMKQLGKFGSDKISFKMSEITAINSEYFDPNYFDPIKISEPNSVRYANNPTSCKDRR